jgi:hypothetical protein
LPEGEVGPRVIYLAVDLLSYRCCLLGLLLDLVPQLNLFQSIGDFLIAVLVEGIDVCLNGSREQCRVLRNYGNVLPQGVKSQLGNVLAVEDNFTHCLVLVFG